MSDIRTLPAGLDKQAYNRRLHFAQTDRNARAAGKLCVTSKMPCLSWSISARHCLTGGKLREVPYSVCSKCYAIKGRATLPSGRAADDRRLAVWQADPAAWVVNMAQAIERARVVLGEDTFQWFDRGDLQSPEMLDDIATVARLTPYVKHWLPTKEWRMVREWAGEVPANLTIRTSAPMIDGRPPRWLDLPQSLVLTARGRERYPDVPVCPAYDVDGGGTCGQCRKCWDPAVKTVAYPLH